MIDMCNCHPTLLIKHTRTWRFPNLTTCAQFLIHRHKSIMSIPRVKNRLTDCSIHRCGRQTIGGYLVHILRPIYTPEIWRTIPNYPGYKVSTHGRVLSLPRIVYRGSTPVHLSGRIMKQTTTYKHYLRTPLNKRGHKRAFNVNDLVALAFIPNPHHYAKINHKDNDRFNNFVTNLEWCNQNYLVHYGHRTEKTYKPIKLVKHRQAYHFTSLWSAARYIQAHSKGQCDLYELHNWLSSCASKNTLYNHIHGYRAYSDSEKHA